MPLIQVPEDRRNAEVLDQAQRLLTKALAPVDKAVERREYLIGDFSGADIMLGHACFMSRRLGCFTGEMTALDAYVNRLEARPAFQTGIQT